MAQLTRPVSDTDHAQGPENAPVTLVEYGDFQCPYCAAAFPVLQAARDRMGNRLRFVFRQFPLTEVHEFAMAAAEAAEAAAAQGKFWEMHDTIYSNQDQLDVEHLRQWAQSLGLNMERFDQAMSRHQYDSRIQEDFLGGVRSGVNGTPTLFINGSRYDGAMDLEELLQALEEAAEPTQA